MTPEFPENSTKDRDGTPPPAARDSLKGDNPRVALFGFLIECNRFTSPADERDFRDRALFWCGDLLRDAAAMAESNGPVHAEFYGTLKRETVARLSAAGLVDTVYALRLKAEHDWNRTWVSSYYDELVCYIPSLRVLREGDYEGSEGMREYGYPAGFSSSVEKNILETVRNLLNEVEA